MKLRCEECGGTTELARGWRAQIVEDEEDPELVPYVVCYCPSCALRVPRVQAEAQGTGPLVPLKTSSSVPSSLGSGGRRRGGCSKRASGADDSLFTTTAKLRAHRSAAAKLRKGRQVTRDHAAQARPLARRNGRNRRYGNPEGPELWWSWERLTSRAEVSSAGRPRFRPDCDANCLWRIARQENLHRSRWSSRSHRGTTWRRRQMCERWRSNGSPARTGRRERCERRIVVVFSRHTRRRDGCCALRVISRTGARTLADGRAYAHAQA
jgi:hypothetical protein